MRRCNIWKQPIGPVAVGSATASIVGLSQALHLPLRGDSRSGACFAAEAEDGLPWYWHLQTTRTQFSHFRCTLCTGWAGALGLCDSGDRSRQAGGLRRFEGDRNTHISPGKPASHVDCQIANRPLLAVEKTVADTSHLAVYCNHGRSSQAFQVVKHVPSAVRSLAGHYYVQPCGLLRTCLTSWSSAAALYGFGNTANPCCAARY